MRVMEPSFATDFELTGVPCFTSKSISIRVGSDGSELTAVTLPTLIPPNGTSVPGANPPAYLR